jgi:DNA helicase HerA-like ATPase
MRIPFGNNASEAARGREAPVVWDSARTINGHALYLGDSGTGKSYTLKKTAVHAVTSAPGKLRVHIIDAHGDLNVEGASSVKFSESTDFGFNPMEVNPDRDFGGVRKRIQSFVSAINRTSHKLGPKQEAVLRNILGDLYAANGFKHDDPGTWQLREEVLPAGIKAGRIYLDVPFEEKDRAKAAGAQFDAEVKSWWCAEGQHVDGLLRWGPKQFGRRHPTVLDAVRFSKKRLNAMFFGTNTATMHFLEETNRLAKSLQSKQMAAARRGEEVFDEKLLKDIDNAKSKLITSFKGYVDSVRTGRELEDIIKYDSSDVLKSVVDRLENLNAIGIFRNTPPPFNGRSAIWHYDIKALSDDEKKLFTTFRLESIFANAIQRGEQKEVTEMILIDEAHLYITDDPEHILNKLIKEARKYGISLVLASQSPGHFSDDLLAGVAVRVILGVDKFYWPVLTRKLGIEEKALNFIVPKKKMIVQMKNAGEMQSNCQWVVL